MILVFFGVLLSCSDAKDQLTLNQAAQAFSKFNSYQDLKFNDVVKIDTKTPGTIIHHDSLLFLITTQTNDNWVDIVSLEQKKIIRNHLKYGAGPEEALGIISAGITGDSLWLYDITKLRIHKYSVNDLIKKEKPTSKIYKVSELFYSMKMLNDSVAIASGTRSSNDKLQFFNIYAQTLEHFGGTYRASNEIPPGTVKDALTSYVNVRPYQGEANIATIGRYTDAIEFFDSRAQQVNYAIHGQDKFHPSYSIGQTQGMFYMYSGALRAEGDRWSFGKTLHVFDWNGNPDIAYQLDQFIYGYDIDEENRKMYAYSEEQNMLVYADL